MTDQTCHFIGGDWVPSSGTELLEVFDSATEELLGRAPRGTAGDGARAVDAAASAFPHWSRLSIGERNQMLRDVSKLLTDRLADLIELAAAESGTPISLGGPLQGLAAATFAMNADLAESYEWSTNIGSAEVVREPIGVVGAISAWNYALVLANQKVAPALASGCTVVLKPTEVAPFSAFLLATAIEEAGIPPGVVNVVSGTGPEVGEALVAHPVVDMIAFTGSAATGKRVSTVASETVKRVSLELGGKSACVVLDDADLAGAVGAAMQSITSNSGQSCGALSRIVVPRSRLEEAKELAASFVEDVVVGDPRDERTTMGPLASAAHRDRVDGYVQAGLAEGMELVTGGPGAPDGLDRGYYVKPTVFVGEARDRLAREEIFGPVQVIVPHDGDENAVEIANSTTYGLCGAVWSSDTQRAEEAAKRMRTGSVAINGGDSFDPSVPFGGYRESGTGRVWGSFGFEEYLETKAIYRPATA